MKPIKVFQNGERLKDIYPHATRTQVLKFRVRSFVRRFTQLLVIALVVLSIYQIGKHQQQDPIIERIDSLPSKIETLKREVVVAIKQCESGGYSENDGVIILDSNNKMSIGQLMFQKATVIHYYRTLYNQTITPKEAVLIALDTNKAQRLAQDIIFNTDKGLSNWLNCANKLQLNTKVGIIKQLENNN